MIKASELPVDTTATALDMANEMFGNGIAVQSASYTGAGSASGTYTDGDSVAPGVTPADSGVILSTGRAEDITNAGRDANASSHTTTMHGTAGDADLSALSGQTTHDAAVLEAQFVPDGSTLTMQVTFSSEEYLEWVDSGFNDAVGIWVNGEKAELTVGSGDITINNINDGDNENLYVDNPDDAESANTEMDGFTVTLTLKAPVSPDEVNDIRIAIADGGDSAYDSNLLIAGDSVQTALVAGDDSVELSGSAPETLDVLANDDSAQGGTLTITQVNGQPVGVGDTVTLSGGEKVTLTDSGLELASDGEPGAGIFSYTVADIAGNTDTAFVNVTTVAPCFTAGTMIETIEGQRPVEALEVGDLVLTKDHGLQPLRWIGRTVRRAAGRDAPVLLEAGALGDHAAIEVSPNHRLLLASPRAEMLFDAHEVLVKARELVNDRTIRRREDGRIVQYLHLLFDRHEVLCGNGLWSESYHPGTETIRGFDAQTEAELRRLFPDLILGRAADYWPAARLSLKTHEARLLMRATPLSRAATR
ncbi:choice-of-anchor L domain-containing protein [Roseovarius sp. SYSU LYC5161]|uniref:choice-of-anchor L domain-containing protein n=1 Tax=Roseovarius halophilus (ex Wu et al. 2025) TaxID=3376060 RepID=UPI0039998006